jgi:hypothetical protein
MRTYGFSFLLVTAVAALGCGSSGGSAKDSGGTGGGGGHGGSGGGGVDAGPPITLFNFNTANNLQTWSFSTYADAMSLNLTGLYPIDGGGGDASAPDAGASMAPALTWDSVDADGSGSSGSLKVTVTYTDFKQYVDVATAAFPPTDLLNKVLHVKIFLDTPDSALPNVFAVQVHASSAGYIYADSQTMITALTVGQWNDVLFDLSAPQYQATGFDPSMIIQVGVQFVVNPAGTAGTAFGAPVDAVFHIDDVTAK